MHEFVMLARENQLHVVICEFIIDTVCGSGSEKSTAPTVTSNNSVLKGNEGDKVITNFTDGQGNKHSSGNGYHPNGVPLSGNEQGIIGGHCAPHGAVHFISPQVSALTNLGHFFFKCPTN